MSPLIIKRPLSYIQMSSSVKSGGSVGEMHDRFDSFATQNRVSHFIF